MTGRCAGCGLIDRNADKVREHTRYCQDFAALYLVSPERALDPEAEFIRWRDEDRARIRQDNKDASVAEADRRRAEQEARWETPEDPLSEN
jgi:hypothetical protein